MVQPRESYQRVLATILLEYLNETVDQFLDGEFQWKLIQGIPTPLWAGKAYGQIRTIALLDQAPNGQLTYNPQFSIYVAETGQEDDGWLIDWRAYLFDLAHQISLDGINGEYNGKTYYKLFRGLLSPDPPIIQRNQKQGDYEIAVLRLQSQWVSPRPYSRTTTL